MPSRSCAPAAIAPGRRTSAALVLSALGDETRRALIAQLTARREARVTDLAAGFDTTRSAISQHLRVLREAGLVQETRQGRERLYRLAPAGFQDLATWMRQYEHFWDLALSRLGDVLDAEAQRESEVSGG